MSISSTIATVESLFKKAETGVKLLPDTSIGSTRILMLVGFVILLIVAKSILTDHLIDVTAALVLGYLLSETVIKFRTIAANERLKRCEMELVASGKATKAVLDTIVEAPAGT